MHGLNLPSHDSLPSVVFTEIQLLAPSMHLHELIIGWLDRSARVLVQGRHQSSIEHQTQNREDEGLRQHVLSRVARIL